MKNLKESIYVYNSIPEIEEKMDNVVDYMSDLPIFYMKRMLRNLKYLFPPTIEEIDPFNIKVALTTSKTKKKDTGTAFESDFSSMKVDEMNQKLANMRENHTGQTIAGSEGETIVEETYQGVDEIRVEDQESGIKEKDK